MFEANDQITNPRQRAFLAAYSELGTVTHAATKAGINRRSHSVWMKDSPEYREAFADAKASVCDLFESEAKRRAVEGVKRFKYHNGKPIIDPATGKHAFDYDFSDTMLIFLLKAANPEKYRERSHVAMDANVTGKVITYCYLPPNGRDPDEITHVRNDDDSFTAIDSTANDKASE